MARVTISRIVNLQPRLEISICSIISIAFYFKMPHFDRLSETISRALIRMQMTARNFKVITSVVKIAITTLEVNKTKN